ncbi:STAS domain-containing protein [Streptomyces sp. H27-H1]|uniref:STAS domain-containing protein n=1 Tax=Streptomyces sp. H27-H1 TaxID=2996461 RepID=UPI0022710B9D|nr:STAS domain-containing protein [Streptomyces sp. H27-H1]MCY0929061.1 STAS domain-containing protein [Streptomyces sp. H27-H1]
MSMESPRVVVRSEGDGVSVLVCSGEFDLDTAGVLRAACERASAAEILVLDVAQVGFADSTFLNLLLKLRKSRRLVLIGPLSEQLLRLLEMTGTLALFEIRENAPEAP